MNEIVGKLTTPQPNHRALDDVLVLTVRKYFWASRECEVFPNRLYTRIFYGHSQNLVNSLFAALRGLVYFSIHRPRLILFGSAVRIVPWFTRFRKAGLLPGVKMIATNQYRFNDAQAQHLDRIIVHSHGEIIHHDATLRDKYEFIPLPADGRFDLCRPSPGDYIFAGGGAERDFRSLIEAVRGLDVQVKIVTVSPETLGYTGELPGNCHVHWRMPLQDFLELMAGSLFVVVPLEKGCLRSHGQTTVVQALRLGKAVVTTKNASVDDYVVDGREGILISPGNVIGYRQAIVELWESPKMRESLERHAQTKALDLTYEVFSRRLILLCQELLAMNL